MASFFEVGFDLGELLDFVVVRLFLGLLCLPWSVLFVAVLFLFAWFVLFVAVLFLLAWSVSVVGSLKSAPLVD